MSTSMAPKGKAKKKSVEERATTPTQFDLDHVPLVESVFKIAEAKCEFDFYELHLWLKQHYLD